MRSLVILIGRVTYSFERMDGGRWTVDGGWWMVDSFGTFLMSIFSTILNGLLKCVGYNQFLGLTGI